MSRPCWVFIVIAFYRQFYELTKVVLLRAQERPRDNAPRSDSMPTYLGFYDPAAFAAIVHWENCKSHLPTDPRTDMRTGGRAPYCPTLEQTPR